MPKACDLSRNSIVSIDGAPHVVESLQVITPSARGAATLFKFRFRNLLTKAKLDQTCKGDDKFGDVDFDRRPVQFLYKEHDDTYTFMDEQDYSQFSLTAGELDEQTGYLTEDLEGIKALVVNGRPVAIDLPAAVVLRVASCEPTLKGQTATARNKTAHTDTGLVVHVPEYVTEGEYVRV
ncbi:MAG: elongation factor P-like protein YeiP, partial [Lentisphaerae bacterium]|nr:elongation factor P-like protein YeiP [Lentisphaerota bacterium]